MKKITKPGKFKIKIGSFGFVVTARSHVEAVQPFVDKYNRLGYRPIFSDKRIRTKPRNSRLLLFILYKPKGCKVIGPDSVMIKTIALTKTF